MMVVDRASRGGFLLLLLFYFCNGRLASPSSSPIEEDDSVIPVFDTVADLVTKISTARGWDLNHVHISNIDSEDARFTKALVYELDIQIGDRVLPAKFIDEATDWHLLEEKDANLYATNEERSSWNSKTLQPVMEPFQLNGPLDFSFQSWEPSLTSSEDKNEFSHWKEVRLAVGSTVEVSGAQEISLANAFELSFPINKSSPIQSLVTSIMLLAAGAQNIGMRKEHESLQLSLQISGPSLMASIKGLNISSHDLNARTLKVFYKEEEEHYDEEAFLAVSDPLFRLGVGSILPFPILNSSDPKFSLLEEMLRLYVGYGYEDYFTVRNAKVVATTYILFEFEIERDLNADDFDPVVWPEWKTRPTARKYAFQVLAKVQNNALIPITVQTVKRHRTVETYAWRELTSNISYTSFFTFLGIPSPMTLDVN